MMKMAVHRQSGVAPVGVATVVGVLVARVLTLGLGVAVTLAVLAALGDWRVVPMSSARAATIELVDRVHAIRRRVSLSADEERRALAVLSGARLTRAAALAYFSAEGGADNHAHDIEELVEGSIRAGLTDALGGARARAVGRYLGWRTTSPSTSPWRRADLGVGH